MDQVDFDFGNGASPDHGVARLHYCGLPIALQCNPRSPNTWKNQGDHLHLSPDDKVSYFNGDRRGKRQSKGFQIVLHLGYENWISLKTKCSIAITNWQCRDEGIEGRGGWNNSWRSPRDIKHQASRGSSSHFHTSQLSRSLCHDQDVIDRGITWGPSGIFEFRCVRMVTRWRSRDKSPGCSSQVVHQTWPFSNSPEEKKVCPGMPESHRRWNGQAHQSQRY